MTVWVPTSDDAPCRTSSWQGHADNTRARARAAESCAPCPILAACLEAAEARGERWGVWGGVDLETKYRRDHTSAPEDATPRRPAECGTPAGYRAHNRRQEAACDPCRAAWKKWTAAYRRRRKEAA